MPIFRGNNFELVYIAPLIRSERRKPHNYVITWPKGKYNRQKVFLADRMGGSRTDIFDPATVMLDEKKLTTNPASQQPAEVIRKNPIGSTIRIANMALIIECLFTTSTQLVQTEIRRFDPKTTQ